MVNKKITFLSILFSIIAIQVIAQIKTEKIRVKAPFKMPVLLIPDFQHCPVFSIVDFGAVQGDKAKTSKAIADAISAANAANGGTVVIGGIYTQDVRDNTQRIPFFGDLPYIGWLFKNREWIDDKTELLVFITPKVVAEGLSVR
jgi:hypothetical protein